MESVCTVPHVLISHLCALKSEAECWLSVVLTLHQQGPSWRKDPVQISPFKFSPYPPTVITPRPNKEQGRAWWTDLSSPAQACSPCLSIPCPGGQQQSPYPGFPLSPLPPGSPALLAMDAHMGHVPSLWWLWEVDYLLKRSCVLLCSFLIIPKRWQNIWFGAVERKKSQHLAFRIFYTVVWSISGENWVKVIRMI